MSFEMFGLKSEITRAVIAKGYTVPTPIQEKAIPPIMAGGDLLGCAQTGTGKTAAFALPIIHRLMEAKKTGYRTIKVLVLAPTRELALQIGASFAAYGRYSGIREAVIFGGVSQARQEQALRRGIDILVACPGRLLDLMGQRLVDLRAVEILVLDESDRMLDMGFLPDVKRIVAAVPARRQTLFFSATMPRDIRELASSILRDPVEVAVDPVATPAEAVEQLIHFVEKADKSELLRHILSDQAVRSALVFTRTKHGADKVVRQLVKSMIPAEAIHGNKSQNARVRALDNFKRGTTRVLVATDIAARGLDIVELSHVVNYDLPNEPESYVHRIGRTGRAGATGIALSFCGADERPYLADIERLIRRRIPVVEDHPYRSTVPQGAPRSAPRPSAPPSRERSGNARSGQRPTGGNRSFGPGRPVGGSRPSGENRSFGPSRPAGGSRPSGENRSFGPSRPAGGSRPSGENRSFGPSRPAGGSRPNGENRSFGPSRPAADSRPRSYERAPSGKAGRRDFHPRDGYRGKSMV
jgi:ATP-dependent RNA helicase RhlE